MSASALEVTGMATRVRIRLPRYHPGVSLILPCCFVLFLTDRAVEDLGMGVRDDTRRGSASLVAASFLISALWGSFDLLCFFWVSLVLLIAFLLGVDENADKRTE
jgi:hypothetical protein